MKASSRSQPSSLQPDPLQPSVFSLSLDRDSILHAFEKVKSIVKKSSLMPVLKNVLVEFAPDAVRVSATDLEISTVVTMPAQFGDVIDMPLKHLLPGALARDVLNKMQPGEMSVAIAESGEINFGQGGYEIEFAALNVDDFPEISVETGEAICTIEGKLLVGAINKVIYAAAKDETRYALTGVAIQIKDEMLYTIATDGFRISVYRVPAEGNANTAAIIIPARAMKLVTELYNNDGIVNISIISEIKSDGKRGDAKFIVFDGPNLLVQSRLINQVFPDYESVISFDDENNGRVCTVSTSYLVAALDRISIAARDSYAQFMVSAGRIDLSIESQIARAKDWLPVATPDWAAAANSDPASYSIVVGQFVDAFGHIAADRADIILPEGFGMIKVVERADAGTPPRHIQGIMPART